MRTIPSGAETDMEAIIPNYNNLSFNLITAVDWMPLCLTVTAMRSEGWIYKESKRKCVGGDQTKETLGVEDGDRD